MDQKCSVLFSVAVVSAVLASSVPAPRGQQPRPNAATSANWPLHNLDLAGSRFSALDQINTSNVKLLSPRWLFQHGVIDGVSNQTTPVIADGTLYVTDSRGSVYAVDAADGHLLWSYDVTPSISAGDYTRNRTEGGAKARSARSGSSAATETQQSPGCVVDRASRSTGRPAHFCSHSTQKQGSRCRASARTAMRT